MKLDRVDSRRSLKPRRDPYWQRLSRGRYVGFRRMTRGSDGTWLARFYDGEKYHQKPLGDFGTIEEKDRFDAAKREAEEWFSHAELGGSTKPGTVRSACEDYVDHLKTESSEDASHDAKKRFERLVYTDPIARVDLAKLAPHHVSAWRTRVLKRIQTEKGSEASFNRNATALRAALNLAKRKGKVSTDLPWAEWLKPIEGAGQPRDLYLNLSKRRALIDSASAESRPFFTALALLPMRPGELAKLLVSHLDVEWGMLRVPKGKTDTREVPLSPEALSHFKACAKNKTPQAWLIARANGGQWTKEAWRDEIKLAAASAKLPRNVVAGTLRHSTITDLVVGGLDLLTIAKVAGTSVAMIEKTYGKLLADHARNALQGLSLKVKRGAA